MIPFGGVDGPASKTRDGEIKLGGKGTVQEVVPSEKVGIRGSPYAES